MIYNLPLTPEIITRVRYLELLERIAKRHDYSNANDNTALNHYYASEEPHA